MRLFLAVAYSAALAQGSWGQSNPPIVDLGYARYQGTTNTNSGNKEFLGIRYATPPIGSLRWKAPQPPPKESNLLLATAQPNRCYQATQGLSTGSALHNRRSLAHNANETQSTLESRQMPRSLPPMSEDCLYLNVYAPPVSPREKLPVIVWIHGGGYVLGAASGLSEFFGGEYNGNDLIEAAGGKVVVVVIQYRLGLFGFLAGRQIKRNGVLNAGLLDQQFALEWVQRHIEKFGGDPRKVTIWGQSAGAGSVLQQLIANRGNTWPPLFRSAILSSSFLPSQYPYHHQVPESHFSQTLELTGCSASRSPVECLRMADVTSLQAANTKICQEAFFGTFALVPVIDGELIRESATEALSKGKVNTRHILAVTNTDEGGIFVDPTLTKTVGEYIKRLFPLLSQRDIRKAESLYGNAGSNLAQASRVLGEAIFVCPTYAILDGLRGSVFKGEFAIPPANHGDDAPYYFSTFLSDGPPFSNPQFVNTFAGAFLDFAVTQNPNTKSDQSSILPAWPKWSPNPPSEVIFNRTADLPDIRLASSEAGLTTRCKFWRDVASSTFQ